MENPVMPSVELTIADPVKGGQVTFKLLFDFEAIATAEDISGRALLTGLTKRDVDHPPISLVRAMLFAALLPHEPEIAFAEASAFVTRKSILPIWGKVLDAWVLAMQDPEEEGSADPQPAQAAAVAPPAA